MDYVGCKLLSHDRMFWVHSKSPNIIQVVLKGAYPKNVEKGLVDVRPILFKETYEDVDLYNLMQEKSRKRSKKIAELCKSAIKQSI